MSGTLLGHLAFGLTFATLVVWIGLFRALRVPRNLVPFTFLFGLPAALGILALVRGTDLVGGIAAVVATANALLFVVLALLGGQERHLAVGVGEPVPDFTAPDDEGRPFTLASLRGRPILLKFFRGHW